MSAQERGRGIGLIDVELGQPEIDQFDMAVLVHHDIVGLEISVHYVFGVKVLQS